MVHINSIISVRLTPGEIIVRPDDMWVMHSDRDGYMFCVMIHCTSSKFCVLTSISMIDLINAGDARNTDETLKGKRTTIDFSGLDIFNIQIEGSVLYITLVNSVATGGTQKINVSVS